VVQKSAFMARQGNMKEAQGYQKMYNRNLRKRAAEDEGVGEIQKSYLGNCNVMYGKMM